MAYIINLYDTTNALVANMQQYEYNFEYLRTCFSGTSAPTVSGAGQTWFDTQEKILKIRNSEDDGWLGVMHGNSNMKIWIFKNSADLGWTIDDSVADVVLSFKGGSEDYDTSGGSQAGTWTQSNHTLTEDQIPSHTHPATGNHTHKFYHYGTGTSAYAVPGAGTGILYNWSRGYTLGVASGGTHTHNSEGGGDPHNHGDTYRPYASVGTLQYLSV